MRFLRSVLASVGVLTLVGWATTLETSLILASDFPSGLAFVDVAPALGIDLEPWDHLSYGPNLVDYDGDGLLDLLFTNHSTPALFRQQPAGQVIDVADLAGITLRTDNHGSAWGDCDGDGWLDLYQTAGAAAGTGSKANRLYRNQGDGTFVDVAEVAGVVDPLGRGRSASWVDYDNDGDLDIYVTNKDRVGSSDQLFANDGDCTFVNVSAQAGDLTSGFHASGVSWADYDNDGDMDVFATPDWGLRTALYRNNGDGTFSDVTGSAGILLEERCVGMAWGDYDNDGYLDLFIAKGYEPVVDSVITSAYALSVTHVIPRGGAADEDGLDFETTAGVVKFTVLFPPKFKCKASELALIHIGPAGESPSACEFSVDSGGYGAPVYQPQADHGLYIWQSGPTSWHVRWSVPPGVYPNTYVGLIEASEPVTVVQEVAFEYPDRGLVNRLYHNNGDGTFDEVAGVQANLNSRDAMWADFDNDGYLDLYVVNAGDTQIGNQPNFLYLNQGDGTFQEVGASTGAAGTGQGLGANGAVGDFNADGFPDIVVQNGLSYAFLNGSHQLLLNQGGDAHWLQVQLFGLLSNRLGIGARVVLITIDGLFQVREMNGGIHCTSQDEMVLSFGLGHRDQVADLTIRWPSGMVQRFAELDVDRRLRVFEPDWACNVALPMVFRAFPVTGGASANSLDLGVCLPGGEPVLEAALPGCPVMR